MSEKKTVSFKKEVVSTPTTTTVEKKERIFLSGLRAFNPHPKAPEFIIAQLYLNVDELAKFLNENTDLIKESEYGQQLKLTMIRGKEGKNFFFEVDTYEKAK